MRRGSKQPAGKIAGQAAADQRPIVRSPAPQPRTAASRTAEAEDVLSRRRAEAGIARRAPRLGERDRGDAVGVERLAGGAAAAIGMGEGK